MTDDRLDAIETRWSLIQQAHASGTGATTEQARQMLVMRYAPAVRRYIAGILRGGDEADDIAQDVMVRLLRGDFAGADQTRGRFRNFLRTAIRNMVKNHWAKQSKKRTTQADVEFLSGSDHEQQEAEWLVAWQTALLDHTWNALKDVERQNPGNPAYTLLRWRAEFPEDNSAETAERLAAKLGSPVRADAVRQMIRRARLRFAELLVREIAIGLDDDSPQGIETELAALNLLEHVRDFLPDDWRDRGELSSS